MSARTAKLVSRGIVVACLAMIVVDAALLTALDRRGPQTNVIVVGDPDAPGMAAARAEIEERLAAGELSGEGPLEAVAFGILGLIWALTGSLIVSRQPRNLAGWIFCLVGVAVPVNGLAFAYTLYGVRLAGAELPGLGLAAILGEYSFATFALIPLLFLLFPDGRPPSPRWAWATRLLVAGFVLAVGAFALQPGPLNNLVDSGILYANPTGVPFFAEGEPGSLLIPIGVVTMLGTSLATVVAVRQRFRRAVGEERQQMRWLVAIATLAGTGLALMLILAPIVRLLELGEEGTGPPIFETLWWLTALAVFLGTPVAYLVAIYRYRLWELDVVVKKTLIAGVLVVIMGSVATAIFATFGQFALWRGTPRVVSVVVGAVVGLLFVPVLRLSRRIADRIVYGGRATPYEVLTEFSRRMAGTDATEDALPRMSAILGAGVGARAVAIWLAVGRELRPRADWPGRATPGAAFPIEELTARGGYEIRHVGELLGAITVEMPANDPMNPGKDRLVRDFAVQAGPVLRNVKLIEELRASRQRLVAAQDEERRRLERNIHDGVQQQLVALNVQLGLLARTAGSDPETVSTMAAALQELATTTLEELRNLARGIYPPLLADRGLVAALEAQARRSPIPVEVAADGLGRYPREVEAAAYFCVLEALQNVAKYADASRAIVRMSAGEGELRFEVEDDGAGFDPHRTGQGTGLQGMADRVDAIGGRLDVRSAPGEGTTIVGRLPIRGAR